MILPFVVFSILPSLIRIGSNSSSTVFSCTPSDNAIDFTHIGLPFCSLSKSKYALCSGVSHPLSNCKSSKNNCRSDSFNSNVHEVA